MEEQSRSDKDTPREIAPSHIRPPGLEFAMGIALFSVVLMVFFLVQSGIFIHGVVQHSPDLIKDGFSFSVLSDPLVEQRMNDLVFNGDLVAQEAFWSGLVCTLLILVTVHFWKREQMALFLGLRLPSVKQVGIWLGVFLLLGLVIEGIARFNPAFQTDFMKQVIGSTTNMVMLFLGVGVLAPVFEEFLLRGLLFGSVRHIMDEHATVAITAGVFTLMHMQYDWTVMLLVLPMGVVLGYSRSRSGSIWVPIMLHMMNNIVTVVSP